MDQKIKAGQFDFGQDADEFMVEDMASLYDLVAAKGELESKLDETKALIATVEDRLFKAMENKDIQSIKHGGRNFYRRVDTYITIKGEAKERGMEWLESHGWGDLIKPSVNSRSLASTVKREMESPEELPQDMFNIVIKNRIGIRK